MTPTSPSSRSRRRVCSGVCFLFLLLLLLLSQQQHGGSSLGVHARTFFSVSDFHYNPYYDESLGESCACMDLGNGAPCPPDSTSLAWRALGQHGCDSPASLVNLTLETMQQMEPNPDFILVPGDLTFHDEWRFNPTQAEADDVLASIISFVTNKIVEVFPDTPVITTLGNDDFYPDYNVTQSWLARIASIWSPLLTQYGDPDAVTTFTKGGYWRATLDNFGGGSLRLVVLAMNTVTYSVKNPNTPADGFCGLSNGNDPYGQLEWLKDQLKQAQSDGDVVWVLGHIPPGVDYFGLATDWKGCYIDDYLELTEPYLETTLRAQVFAHEHSSLYYMNGPPPSSGGPGSLVAMMNSAVSPIYSNNPTYRTYEYSENTLSLTDFSDRYLAMGSDGPQEYQDLYTSAKDEYSLTSFDSSQWWGFIERMAQGVRDGDTSLFELYWANVFSLSPHANACVEELCRIQQLCLMAYMTEEDYINCINTFDATPTPTPAPLTTGSSPSSPDTTSPSSPSSSVFSSPSSSFSSFLTLTSSSSSNAAALAPPPMILLLSGWFGGVNQVPFGVVVGAIACLLLLVV
eukprot:TRINITY_DN1924_c0_g1_i1.p1 TRINITY_DN1924_c0_g1~~TRINITY_DN1924_c0_g1_i1.p1  ORF type:complete len:572 (-),score=82.67 TRINITY_DN1924_c0_g1_i1:35-1750(-)